MSCRTNSVVHYMETLDAVAKERYLKKLELIDGIDPYSIKPDQCTREAVDFPNLSYPDIVNYLVHSQSAYTLESLKSYKSLESYNQFVCGWVKDVRLKVINKCVITAKVQHSQRMSATPLKPWIIAQRPDTSDYAMTSHCEQTSMVVDTNVICICRQQYDEENGEPAIGCDNQNCDYQWWHLTCAKVTTIPKGAWYCPECKKLPQFCNEG